MFRIPREEDDEIDKSQQGGYREDLGNIGNLDTISRRLCTPSCCLANLQAKSSDRRR